MPPSNLRRLYDIEFDQVLDLFNKGEDFSDACLALLADPALPLRKRVQCNWMYAWVADEPKFYLNEAKAFLAEIQDQIDKEWVGKGLQSWVDRVSKVLDDAETDLCDPTVATDEIEEVHADIEEGTEEELERNTEGIDEKPRVDTKGVEDTSALTGEAQYSNIQKDPSITPHALRADSGIAFLEYEMDEPEIMPQDNIVDSQATQRAMTEASKLTTDVATLVDPSTTSPTSNMPATPIALVPSPLIHPAGQKSGDENEMLPGTETAGGIDYREKDKKIEASEQNDGEMQEAGDITHEPEASGEDENEKKQD